MPLTEVDKESIKKVVATKAKLMDSDPRNTPRDCIPVVMPLRVFYKKPYSQSLDLAWTERLGRSIHNSVPALESAVGDLDKVVYEKGSCLEDQCAICLGIFFLYSACHGMPSELLFFYVPQNLQLFVWRFRNSNMFI